MATSVPEIGPSTCPRPVVERKARPQKDQALNCPRCHSTNTKFCYYNNYSLTQPRYFCKTCRRYWTEGGSLRNVPVGGGSRKNRRSTTSTSSSANSSNKLLDLNPPSLPQFSPQNPIKILEGQDLNLAFPTNKQDFHGATQFLELAKIDNNSSNYQLICSASSTSSTLTPLPALEPLRTGISSRGLNSFIPTPIPDANMLYTSGFPFQDLKPNFVFSADGLAASRYGGLHVIQENSGRVMLPFGAVNKQISSSNEVDQDKVQGNPTGFWNGMLGGRSW